MAANGANYTPPSKLASSPSPAKFADVDEAEELNRIVLEEHGGGSLQIMHERSKAVRVDKDLLSRSCYAIDRRGITRWLIDAFEHAQLKDEWLVSAIFLLDRLAVSPRNTRGLLRRLSSQISTERDHMARILAVVLCVLKMSASDEELGLHVREIIFKIARKQNARLWQQVIDAEFAIYNKLDYKVAVPSFADLTSRIMLDIVAAAKGAPSIVPWPGLAMERVQQTNAKASTPRIVAFSDFLIEVSLVHAYADVYREGAPPIAVACAIARLALHAFGSPPPACVAALELVESQILGVEEAERLIHPIACALHSVWKTPPADSRVVRKWNLRELARLVHLPEVPESLIPQVQQVEVQACMSPKAATPQKVCTPPKPSRRQSPPTTGPRLPRPDRPDVTNTQQVSGTLEPDSVSKTSKACANRDDFKAKASPPTQIPPRAGLRRLRRTTEVNATPKDLRKRKLNSEESGTGGRKKMKESNAAKENETKNAAKERARPVSRKSSSEHSIDRAKEVPRNSSVTVKNRKVAPDCGPRAFPRSLRGSGNSITL